MDSVATIPIFPLSTVVLFPGLRVPLFIFEPRYRQMTQAALDGDRRIGMTVVMPLPRQHRLPQEQERQEQTPQLEGDPSVFDIGCEGMIEEAERRPDGTFHLILLGRRCFRIIREVPRQSETLYRECEVKFLPDAAFDPGSSKLSRLRDEVQLAYGEFLQRRAPQHIAHFESTQFRSLSLDIWTNTLSLSLDCEVIEKQSLLEASSISERLQGLITILEFQSADRANPLSTEPDAVQ